MRQTDPPATTDTSRSTSTNSLIPDFRDLSTANQASSDDSLNSEDANDLNTIIAAELLHLINTRSPLSRYFANRQPATSLLPRRAASSRSQLPEHGCKDLTAVVQSPSNPSTAPTDGSVSHVVAGGRGVTMCQGKYI